VSRRPRKSLRLPAAACGLAVALLPTLPLRADIWSYEAGGVIHFTNIPPAGPSAHSWRVEWKSGPGKAAVVSGSSAAAGCEKSRADVVASRDQSPERYHRYDREIGEAATVYALPEALLRAVIHVESDYDPQVVSCAGARGLMQLMPDVATEQKVSAVFDPRQNILGGARLLRLLANRFHGDLVLTVAGYHAGAGAVQKYSGVPPYETTQRYVYAILQRYQTYKISADASRHPSP
jgi:soluble lytic murein transglycosylase-like protein